MIIYKNYGKGYLGASLLSALGGLCGFAGVIAFAFFIWDGFKQPLLLLAAAVGIAALWGLRTLADIVYVSVKSRKEKK